MWDNRWGGSSQWGMCKVGGTGGTKEFPSWPRQGVGDHGRMCKLGSTGWNQGDRGTPIK